MYTSSVFNEDSQATYAAATANKRQLPSNANDNTNKTIRNKRDRDEAVGNKPKNVGAIICRSNHPLALPADKDWPTGKTARCPDALQNGSRLQSVTHTVHQHVAHTECTPKKFVIHVKPHNGMSLDTTTPKQLHVQQ